MVSWDTLCECDVEALEKTWDSFSQEKPYAIHENLHSLISETTEILKTNLLWFCISIGSSLVGLPFQSHFSFCLSLYNIISYMNFSIRSSETYYCCFSSESCPPIKIFQPHRCQWCIRTETGWSCRWHLSVDPIIPGFYVPGILDKMSMFRKSKSKMMFQSESFCWCLSGPDLSISARSNITAICYNSEGISVHKGIYAGVLTRELCYKLQMKPRRLNERVRFLSWLTVQETSLQPFSVCFLLSSKERFGFV